MRHGYSRRGIVPFLLRFARALTGSQNSGDACVVAAIEQLLEDRNPSVPARIGLYRAVLHQVNGLESRAITLGLPSPAMESVQRNLAGLLPWAARLPVLVLELDGGRGVLASIQARKDIAACH